MKPRHHRGETHDRTDQSHPHPVSRHRVPLPPRSTLGRVLRRDRLAAHLRALRRERLHPRFPHRGRLPIAGRDQARHSPCRLPRPHTQVERGLRGHWQNDVLILGINPLPQGFDTSYGADPTFPPAGILGEFRDDWATGWNDGEEIGTKSGWSWDTGGWFTCRECGGINVYHQLQAWKSRPCGHYDGDHLLGDISTSLLDRHWANACNAVKWRGTAGAARLRHHWGMSDSCDNRDHDNRDSPCAYCGQQVMSRRTDSRSRLPPVCQIQAERDCRTTKRMRRPSPTVRSTTGWACRSRSTRWTRTPCTACSPTASGSIGKTTPTRTCWPRSSVTSSNSTGSSPTSTAAGSHDRPPGTGLCPCRHRRGREPVQLHRSGSWPAQQGRDSGLRGTLPAGPRTIQRRSASRWQPAWLSIFDSVVRVDDRGT